MFTALAKSDCGGSLFFLGEVANYTQPSIMSSVEQEEGEVFSTRTGSVQ